MTGEFVLEDEAGDADVFFRRVSYNNSKIERFGHLCKGGKECEEN